MIEIEDEQKCCGCSACENICPKHCIVLKPNYEGFLYPQIDRKQCINCDLCEKVCPMRNVYETGLFQRKTFVVRAKDIDILYKSTSGGFITPLATWIMEQGGYLCAATYDKDFNVVHQILYGEEGIQRLKEVRGSKYVQSRVEGSYTRVRELLDEAKRVCFVGTTCQVYGLLFFLKMKGLKNPANLITVDLVCHGTSSPKLWRKYVEYQTKKGKSAIEEISFRNKTYGYHSGTMKIQFSNGKIYYGSARVDYMLKSFFKEISSRPSCYSCPFRGIERCSDFTIFDCWHAEKLVDGLVDDDKGYTNVIVQSEKGLKILKEISDELEEHEVNTEMAVKLDGIMVNQSATKHIRRDDFYKELDKHDLCEHIQEFIPIKRKDYIIEKGKKIIYKMGILNKLKQYYNR